MEGKGARAIAAIKKFASKVMICSGFSIILINAGLGWLRLILIIILPAEESIKLIYEIVFKVSNDDLDFIRGSTNVFSWLV